MTKPHTSKSPKWRSCAPGDIAWAGFGDEFVAYHRPSGKTHFLNAASRLLICDILTEPRSFAEIADRFAAGDADGQPQDYLEQMSSLLDHLEIVGLVERV